MVDHLRRQIQQLTSKEVCVSLYIPSVRAIHIEMAYAIDSTSFLNALSQMINRRGCPIEVISGNRKTSYSVIAAE